MASATARGRLQWTACAAPGISMRRAPGVARSRRRVSRIGTTASRLPRMMRGEVARCATAAIVSSSSAGAQDAAWPRAQVVPQDDRQEGRELVRRVAEQAERLAGHRRPPRPDGGSYQDEPGNAVGVGAGEGGDHWAAHRMPGEVDRSDEAERVQPVAEGARQSADVERAARAGGAAESRQIEGIDAAIVGEHGLDAAPVRARHAQPVDEDERGAPCIVADDAIMVADRTVGDPAGAQAEPRGVVVHR